MLTTRRIRSLAARRPVYVPWSCCNADRRWSSAVRHDPLRVLFCGADPFSIASLKALNDVRLRYPGKVASIDVVCRPGKRAGRGLAQIRELPIKSVAVDELDLPLHQIDTFTGWTPPCPAGEPINLVVAVSFGLLVPPRILKASKYGGLNVHPSMLPDLAGSAPLHHALLEHDKTIGVTLQTLHPKHFDQGAIVDQTPLPGIEIPKVDSIRLAELAALVAPLGAEMLRKNILSGSFADGRAGGRAEVTGEYQKGPRHAPKITQEDRHIDWASWKVKDFLVRDRVIGRLWDTDMARFFVHTVQPTAPRIIYSDWEEVDGHVAIAERLYIRRGSNEGPFVYANDQERRVIFECVDGLVSPRSLTIEGKPQVPGSRFWAEAAGSERSSNGRHSVRMPEHSKVSNLTSTPRTSAATHVAPKRSYVTSTKMPTLEDMLGKEETIDHPQISWNFWTMSRYLSSANKSCSSFHPLLHHILPSTSTDVTSAPPMFTFHNFTDVTTSYRKLIYRGQELYTSLPTGTSFEIGAPVFLSKDPEKRLMFWVWADEKRVAIGVVSPESLQIEGKTMKGEEVWDHWMSGKEERKARLIGREELGAFHRAKSPGLGEWTPDVEK